MKGKRFPNHDTYGTLEFISLQMPTKDKQHVHISIHTGGNLHSCTMLLTERKQHLS